MKRTALITGGASGIGRAVTEAFAALDYNCVVAYYSSQKPAHDLIRSLNERGVGCMSVQCDVSDGKSVGNLYEKVHSVFGFVDTVVNNAGVSHIKLFTDETDADYARVMNVNFKGAADVIKRFAPDMISRGFGRIINISSMWGVCGASAEALYSASKAGLIGLTKALAKELGPSGITVNAVAPGLIDTPMNADLSRAAIEEMIAATPMGRIGQPSDVAEAVCFLAGESASFITGQVLTVDGGLTV